MTQFFKTSAVFAVIAAATLAVPAQADDHRFDRNGAVERHWDSGRDRDWDNNRDHDRGRDDRNDNHDRNHQSRNSYQQGYRDALRANNYNNKYNYNGYYGAPRGTVTIINRQTPYDFPAYSNTNTTVYSYGNLTPLPRQQSYYYYSYR